MAAVSRAICSAWAKSPPSGGQTVAAGDVVGKATAAHNLIYEIRIGNKSVDPAKVIAGQSGLQYRENL